MTNLEEIEKKKKELKNISKKTEESITAKQENIEKEKNNIILLTQYKNNIDFTHDLLHTTVPKADQLPPEIFYQINASISGSIQSTCTAEVIALESQQSLNKVEDHASTINASLPVIISGSTNLYRISENNPKYFKEREKIIEKFNIKDQLENNINYIISQLPDIVPNVSKDFEKFYTNFLSEKPSTDKYIDLIGSRSLFFHKLIFAYSLNIIGSDITRRMAIEFFVTNGVSLEQADEPIITNAEKLWHELSEQDDLIPNSVKLGKVSAEYNELLFRRIISTISSLLILRTKYI